MTLRNKHSFLIFEGMKNFFVFSLFLIQTIAQACDCNTPPLSKEICAQYDVVFAGTVDSVSPCNTKGDAIAYFTIVDLYKGNAEQHIAVTFDCASSCMMSFAKKEEWIIYSTYSRFNKCGVAFCSHSRKRVATAGDPYATVSTYTFDGEKEFLKANLGSRSFAAHNELNDQQEIMRPTNEQPSGMNKLLLLGGSLLAMLVIYFVSKKYFKNDK